MKVSVIIVCFRAYQELADCLVSVDGQSRPPAEVIVVDQAGAPGELGVIAGRFPRVTFIEVVENKGFAGGVNLGAQRATGDGLLVLNPDCVLEPTALGELAGWLQHHPGVGIVGPRIRNSDGSRQASARRFPDWTTGIAGRRSWLSRVLPANRLSRGNLLSQEIGDDPVRVDWVSGACFLVRREAFDAVGGFDPGFFLYWEDADFCRRLVNAGWQTWHHPGPEVTHAVGRSSRRMPVRALVAFHRSAFRYYWKHGSVLARALAPIAAGLLVARLGALLAAARLVHLRPGRGSPGK